MLGRMENRGLVRRIPSEEGGKRNQISLTKEGKAMADTLRSYMPQEADKIFAGLSQEELEAAGHVFRAICRNVSGSQNAQMGRGEVTQSE